MSTWPLPRGKDIEVKMQRPDWPELPGVPCDRHTYQQVHAGNAPGIPILPAVQGEVLFIASMVCVLINTGSESYTETDPGSEQVLLRFTTAWFVLGLQSWCCPMMSGPGVKPLPPCHHILGWKWALKITATGMDKMMYGKCSLLGFSGKTQ